MACKYVVGTGAALDWAVAAWREVAPTLTIERVALDQNSNYAFDLSVLDTLVNDGEGSAFAACNDQFLNFRRFELMGELKARGFSMPPLICTGAIVAASASIGENATIGAGAIIGHDCKVDYNAVVGAGANIGAVTRIGSSAWIEAGVLVGRAAKIGANTSIGQGVIVADGVEVGKLSIVDKPGKLVAHVASKTFLHGSFDQPIVIVEN